MPLASAVLCHPLMRPTLLIVVGVMGCNAGASPRTLTQRSEPEVALATIDHSALCVTKGELARGRVDTPTFRAVARSGGGDAASLRFVLRGASEHARPLASGHARRQLGLKLRAQDGCNLLYAMWRLDPKPMFEVSLKRNPGSRTHHQCGARGYTKLRSARAATLPPIDDEQEHELRAEILGDELVAWIDGRVVWHGRLPREARELTGPAGLRADNLAFELAGIATDARNGVDVACEHHAD